MGIVSTPQDSFFSAADAYERFMGRWSRRLASLVVRFAGVRRGEYVLDVGSGTGALAAAVAGSAPEARVLGIDPAAAYVARAQSTVADTTTVAFETGDAQQLRFDEAMFDRTLSMLAFNFIPDARRALREMRRVTRPAGTIAAAVWDYGDGMEMLRLFWDEAIALVPSEEPKDERHMPFCRPGELGALWREHGLLAVVEQSLVIETPFSGFADYWMPFTLQQGPAGAFVAGLGSEQRQELQHRLRRRLLGDAADRAFVLQARAWAVRGAVQG